MEELVEVFFCEKDSSSRKAQREIPEAWYVVLDGSIENRSLKS